MPNWCENTLIITGLKEEIEKFLEQAKNLSNEEKYISLERLFPVPEELTKDSKDLGGGMRSMSDEEWKWRLENWGTKWDLSNFSDPEWFLVSWEISFESAWSPPYESIVKIAGLFPQLTFDLRYFEPGMNFKGRLKISGDNIEEDWEGSIL